MRTPVWALPIAGAGINDFNRAWAMLHEQFPGEWSIELEPGSPKENPADAVLIVQLIRLELAPDQNTRVKNVWAQKVFGVSGYLISWGQLYDLLIVGTRRLLEDKMLSSR